MRKPPPEYANWTPRERTVWHLDQARLASAAATQHAADARAHANRAKQGTHVAFIFASIALVLILAVLVMEVTS